MHNCTQFLCYSYFVVHNFQCWVFLMTTHKNCRIHNLNSVAAGVSSSACAPATANGSALRSGGMYVSSRSRSFVAFCIRQPSGSRVRPTRGGASGGEYVLRPATGITFAGGRCIEKILKQNEHQLCAADNGKERGRQRTWCIACVMCHAWYGVSTNVCASTPSAVVTACFVLRERVVTCLCVCVCAFVRSLRVSVSVSQCHV